MPYYEQLKTLVSNHLEDLEHNRLPVIERRTGFSIPVIQQALTELRKLKPKPGAEFGDTFVPNVTPDVFVELDDTGKYKVRLEDGRTPSLYISSYYRQMLASGQANAETRKLVDKIFNSAQWLIEAIEQHRNTLTRVAQAIVDHQTEFLSKGPESIEPLKMQQIADKVKVHVTTVSRTVTEQVDSDSAWNLPAQAVLLRRYRECRWRRSGLGRRAAQVAGSNWRGRTAGAAERRRTGQGTGQARSDRRPPDRD